MIEWVLILYIYAGPWAKGDSVALTSIGGFASQQECSAAGTSSSKLTESSAKEVRFVCVQRTK